MSLRGACWGVDLTAMEAVLGSADPESGKRWKQRLPEVYSEERYRRGALQIIDWLLATPPSKRELRTENEAFAIVMHLLAELFTLVPQGPSSFFETLVARIAAPQSRIEWFRDYRGVFSVGRPLVGDTMESNWSYYAYLRKVEAATLFEKMKGDGRISYYFEAEEGLSWMQSLVDRGADLWMFAS